MRQIDGLHASILQQRQCNYVSSKPMPVLNVISRPKELCFYSYSLSLRR